MRNEKLATKARLKRKTRRFKRTFCAASIAVAAHSAACFACEITLYFPPANLLLHTNSVLSNRYEMRICMRYVDDEFSLYILFYGVGNILCLFISKVFKFKYYKIKRKNFLFNFFMLILEFERLLTNTFQMKKNIISKVLLSYINQKIIFIFQYRTFYIYFNISTN